MTRISRGEERFPDHGMPIDMDEVFRRIKRRARAPIDLLERPDLHAAAAGRPKKSQIDLIRASLRQRDSIAGPTPSAPRTQPDTINEGCEQ
jgi:hypothetical protein